MDDPIIQFQRVITESGLGEPTIIPDGEIHRFQTTDDKSGAKSGWFVFHQDRIAAGAFGSWKTSQQFTWCEKDKATLSSAEKAAYRASIERAKAQRDTEQRLVQDEAAKECQELWNKATESIDHQYVTDKGLKPYGLHQMCNMLLVPLYLDGDLVNLQFITADGTKRFKKGGRVNGCCCPIGEASDVIYICEGFATGSSIFEAMGGQVVVAFNAGNLKSVAETIHKKYGDADITICADNDQWTDGNPGITKAKEAAEAIGAAFVAPQFSDTSTRPTDFNDLHKLSGLEAVIDQLNKGKGNKWNKPAFHEVDDCDLIIEILARLKPTEYKQYRRSIATRFKLQLRTLDTAVKERRGEVEGQAQENGLLVNPPEPWDDSVDGAELLNSICEILNRYIVMPDHADTALSLWALGTYVYDSFRLWPRLLVTSPVKRCGKTTLLEVIEAVARCAMSTSNITAAALFRTIDEAKPTITIDEADTFLRDNDHLRGIINSGHTKKGAYVIRCDGDDYRTRRFSTWCSVAIFMIKLPADTIVDRSIVIELRRKLPAEKTSRMPLDLYEQSEPIRQKAERWAQDHAESLKGAAPSMPNCLNDRALDNWTPLFAIADAAGGDWPTRVRKAFAALAGIEDDDDSIGAILLEDIRRVFDGCRTDRIFSGNLVDDLIKFKDSPWSEWNHGKPITQNSLSRLLKPFNITSKQIKIGGSNRHGYKRGMFEDAFKRYIPPKMGIQSATPLLPTAGAASSDFENATGNEGVAFEKTLQPTVGEAGSGVAVQSGGYGEKIEKDVGFI